MARISIAFVRSEGKAEHPPQVYISRATARSAAEEVLAKAPGLYARAVIYEDSRAVEIIPANSDANDDPRLSDLSPRLKRELEAARRRLQVATETFNDIISEVPSGLPLPDGTQLIANASAECSSARREFIRTLKRLNDYVIHGVVPEDDDTASEIQ